MNLYQKKSRYHRLTTEVLCRHSAFSVIK